MSQIRRGCLLLADISGYTKYLSGVELDHSHDILADLLSVVVGTLQGGGMRLAKLEGDAVFCHVEDAEGEADGSTLVTLVEGCYFAFRERLRDIEHATTCTCEACRRIPTLNLKFLVHHGEYVVHEVLGNQELVGSDVVLAHRLLKNSVTDRTGLRGYALFTARCLFEFRIDAERAGLTLHREEYEDVGAIKGYLLDLERRWAEEQERTSVYLGPGEAALEVVEEMPAPPPVVWDLLTSPRQRARWQVGVTRVDQENPADVRGVGTTNHCVHGQDAVVEQILDWKPFRYFSDRSHIPGGTALCTVELTPADGGTRVAYRLHPEAPEEAMEMAIGMLEVFEPLLRQSFARMRDLIREEATQPA